MPLCRLLRAGVESVYPSGSFSQRWARVKDGWVKAPYMRSAHGNMKERMGRKVCRLKGRWLGKPPSPIHTARQSRAGISAGTRKIRFWKSEWLMPPDKWSQQEAFDF